LIIADLKLLDKAIVLDFIRSKPHLAAILDNRVTSCVDIELCVQTIVNAELMTGEVEDAVFGVLDVNGSADGT